MLNILQCMQVCELRFWKQFVYCKQNLCSVRELLLNIMEIASTQYLGEKKITALGIFLMYLLVNIPLRHSVTIFSLFSFISLYIDIT